MTRATVSMKDEKSCRNCKYFNQHYVKNPYGGFCPCNAGHCTYRRAKIVKCNQLCEAFAENLLEDDELQKSLGESIVSHLSDML